jgi:two-component system LytT family response regulator
VHSSFLININRIKKLIRGEGGYIIMDNDAMVSISRSKRQEFMEKFEKF